MGEIQEMPHFAEDVRMGDKNRIQWHNYVMEPIEVFRTSKDIRTENGKYFIVWYTKKNQQIMQNPTKLQNQVQQVFLW